MRFVLIIAVALIVITLLVALVVFLFVLAPADRRLLFGQNRTIPVAGEKRSYRLMNAAGTEPKPLIVALHGFDDRSWWLAAYSGLHVLAENEGAALALPNGKHRSWNGVFCCGWAQEHKTDDVSFIAEMVDDIKANHAIDESRIYVVGFSNGGILAQHLLAQKPDIFAAGTSVMSGVGDGSTTLDITNARAPLLLIQGTKDNRVPLDTPSESEGFSFIPAAETARIWAQHYNLSDKQLRKTNNYTEYTWASDEKQQLVQRIYESSHRWPNWRLWSFPNNAPRSTQDIWNFLRQHEL